MTDLELTLEAQTELIAELLLILKEARPIVFNALHHPDAQPWQKEIRIGVLCRIDAALKPHRLGGNRGASAESG